MTKVHSLPVAACELVVNGVPLLVRPADWSSEGYLPWMAVLAAAGIFAWRIASRLTNFDDVDFPAVAARSPRA